MTETFTLEAQTREKSGTKSSALLRKQGKMPAVVYGHGQDTISIAVDLRKFVDAIQHGHKLMTLNIDGQNDTVLVREVQYDYLGKDMIHADMVRVDLTETVQVAANLKLRGTAQGTAEGGMIDIKLPSIEIECSVAAMPDHLDVPMKAIKVGDVLHAGDIELPSGVKLVTAADAVVLTCHLVAAAKSTEELEEEETPVSPEVIGEKADEESGE